MKVLRILGVYLVFVIAAGTGVDAKGGYYDVPNGDFEEGPCCVKPPRWVSWSQSHLTGVQFNAMVTPGDATDAHTGFGYGRLEADGSQNGWMAMYGSYIDTGGVTKAKLNAYIRTNMKNVFLRLYQWDSSWNYLGRTNSNYIKIQPWYWAEYLAHHGSFTFYLNRKTRYVLIGIVGELHGGSDRNYLDVDDVSLVLNPPPCADECYVGETVNGNECRIYNRSTGQFESSIPDGAGNLHNRARTYTAWLRDKIMPAGGVLPAVFTDGTYTNVKGYDHTRDSALMTGIYLAAEALRYMTTDAQDAQDQIDAIVRTLDRWLRISGDRGYLARIAAPTTSSQEVLDIFDPGDYENHRNVSFEGETWHWKGYPSRDQYQGVMLGYSFAYEATDDEAVKEIIRARVVDVVEQLMVNQDVELLVDFIGGGQWTQDFEMVHCVFTDDEGVLGIDVPLSNLGEAGYRGFQCWYPNLSDLLRQINGFGWLPDIMLRSQAVQLGSMFRVALQVTAGVPAYASRRAAIEAHYNSYITEWADAADGWENNNYCGDGYHGINTAFLPLWNWIRLEDGWDKEYLQINVLQSQFWPEVEDHKNVLFAFINTSQAHASVNVPPIINSHLAQLELFPTAPNDAPPVDNTWEYTENPLCSGLSSVAIDVDDRVPRMFMWEKNPWKLVDAGIPNYLHTGVDYLIAYWMARYYGYLADDAVNKCLKFD